MKIQSTPVAVLEPSFVVEVFAVSSVHALHDVVERRAHYLHVLHAERLHCARGCSGCCVDDLSVFPIEAEHIKVHHAGLLSSGVAHALGSCAFLDSAGACRIYAERPYVCRTQGLPLRWLDEDSDAEPDEPPELRALDGRTALDVQNELVEPHEPREHRDICPLNDVGPPIEGLAADQCWTLGPAEERLARLQLASAPGSGRVSLRSLFALPKAGA